MADKFQVVEGYAELTIHDSSFRRTLGRVQASMVKVQARMEKVAVAARRMLLVGGAAIAGMVKVAADFEQSMARVRALTGASGAEFKKLESAARELGKTTQFSASQAAEAMAFFAQAGFDSTKIIEAMPATLNLAAAGQLEMGQAADIVAKIMGGMGLEAAELGNTVDILAKAFTTSNTDLVQLGDAMKFVGPVAKIAGKDMSETVAVLQTMAQAGLQGGLAGTAFRGILAKLAGNGKEVSSVFGFLGVKIKDVDGNLRNTADIVEDFNRALGEKGVESADAMGMAIKAFGLRAGPGFTALLEKGAGTIRDFESALDDVGGTADNIAKVQMDTLTGSFKKMWSQISESAIKIGGIFMPMIERMAAGIEQFADWLNSLDERTLKFFKTMVIFVGSLGLLLVILPKIIGMFAGMLAVVGGIAGAGGLVIGLGLLTAGIGAVAAILLTAIATGDSFAQTLSNIGIAAGDAIKALLGLDKEEKARDERNKKQKETNETTTSAEDALKNNDVGAAISAIQELETERNRIRKEIADEEEAFERKPSFLLAPGPLSGLLPEKKEPKTLTDLREQEKLQTRNIEELKKQGRWLLAEQEQAAADRADEEFAKLPQDLTEDAFNRQLAGLKESAGDLTEDEFAKISDAAEEYEAKKARDASDQDTMNAFSKLFQETMPLNMGDVVFPEEKEGPFGQTTTSSGLQGLFQSMVNQTANKQHDEAQDLRQKAIDEQAALRNKIENGILVEIVGGNQGVYGP